MLNAQCSNGRASRSHTPNPGIKPWALGLGLGPWAVGLGQWALFYFVSAACAAASRATGTRYGEQLT
jgi:hypothetical protein